MAEVAHTLTSAETSPSREKNDYNIHLNFLSVEMGDCCVIHRRRCTSPQEQRPTPEATAQKLPVATPDEKEWPSYWVLPAPTDGFERFEFQPLWNADVSRRILFDCLKRSVESSLETAQYHFPNNSFIQEVSFIMETHAEGEEELVVQPYSLKALQKTGFLVDFYFRMRKGVTFGRKVQQLSLSLDKNFRRNIDHYVDRSSKIRRFLDVRWSVFENLSLPGSSERLQVSKDFAPLPAEDSVRRCMCSLAPKRRAANSLD